MKIKSSDSVRIYRTYGGGCLLIGGIPMVGIGASLIIGGIFVLYRSTESAFLLIAAGLFLVGALILSIAIPIVSTRRGVTLDRIQGTATEWRKIFGHHKIVAIHRLNEFHTIVISDYIESGQRLPSYLVEFTGDSKKIVLCRFGLDHLAKETAEDASGFLSLSVTNKVTVEDEP